MQKGEKSKRKIIEESAVLFLQKGYYQTSIQDILKATNLPKGSFYFYFKGKEQLGQEVAKFYGEEIQEWFQRRADQSKDWKEYIEFLTGDILEAIEKGDYYGCPFTIFATETSYCEPEIATICEQAIRGMVQIFARVIQKQGGDQVVALEKGGMALSMYEGFLVYYRITRQREVILRMKQSLLCL